MNTRDKIIDQARILFNDHGYHNITITDIATACTMSRGNLAYHYKTKDALLSDLAQRMEIQIESLQRERKNYPAFSNLNLDISICKVLQQDYIFIFRDMTVLDHSDVKRVIKSWSEYSIAENIEAFRFGREIGNLREESFPGLYQQLSLNAWLITFYWVSQSAVREIHPSESPEQMVWTTIYQHFTEKGKQAFHTHFGENYFKAIPSTSLIKSESSTIF